MDGFEDLANLTTPMVSNRLARMQWHLDDLEKKGKKALGKNKDYEGQLKREINASIKLLDKVVNVDKKGKKKSGAGFTENRKVQTDFPSDESNLARELGLSAEEFKQMKTTLKEGKESGAKAALLSSKRGHNRSPSDVGPFEDDTEANELQRLFSDSSDARKQMQFQEFKLGQRKKKAKLAHPVWK